MGRRPAASVLVAAPRHQQTESTLAQHLALSLTTASVTMQLASGKIFLIMHVAKLWTPEKLM